MALFPSRGNSAIIFPWEGTVMTFRAMIVVLFLACSWGCGNGKHRGDADAEDGVETGDEGTDTQDVPDAEDTPAEETPDLPDVPGNNPPENDIPADDLAGGTGPFSSGTCPMQGLDEMCRRRDLVPVKPFDAVIEADGWSQPETLIFHDLETGVPVLRLTDDPAGNTIHCHINRSTFNADGTYVGFLSRRCWPDMYCPDNYRYIAALDGKGPHIISVPREHMLAIGRHETWDPANPDVFYFVNHGENNGFYRVTVNGGAFDTERLLELPNPDRRKSIFVDPAPDGTVVIKDTPVEGEPMNVYVWHPSSPGEVVTFDLELGVTHPSHSAAEEWHTHDFTLRRNAESTVIFNYGPEGDVGEPLFIELATDGSKAWRYSYAPNEDTSCPVPYYSHPAWNHDGTLVLFNGTAEKFVDGTNPDGTPRWVWNDSEWGTYIHAVSPFAPGEGYATSTLVVKVAPLDLRIGHMAWDGYDDRWVHGTPSGGVEEAYPYPLYRMAADGSATELMVTTYARSRCTDDCDYCSLPRPAQSPDATKVLFASDMLQAAANAEDVYIAVHRYPYAPVWLGLASATELVVAWRLHPGLSREIGSVRILRSPDVDPLQLETAAIVDAGGTFADDATELAEGESVLYAAAAIENGGLESLSLSRIIRVTLSGGELRVDQVTPYGTQGFDLEPPADPSGLTASSPAAGQVRLAWTAPGDPDLRGFNLYASIEGPPDVDQSRLIATLPAGHPTFLDWSFGTAAQVSYAVTAVDWQGNESGPARADVSP
jgi:hypothetical protein